MGAGSTDDDDATPGDPDRRSADRLAVAWSVDCETEDTFLYAAITNISALGIFVRTLEPLPPGTRLRLTFTACGDARDRESFLLDGRVQWINPARPGCPNPGMGIRFLGLLPEDRERLVALIRTIAYLREDIDQAS